MEEEEKEEVMLGSPPVSIRSECKSVIDWDNFRHTNSVKLIVHCMPRQREEE